ncbi:MAG: MBL fold metallo-hydrolase [Dehalococcoidia bacterium]|nr:MBL fold metallo-hydrolase [Dehalococcoidia bacterium]
MKLTIVYDNEVKKEGLIADWGFSCLIEGNGIPATLFDTGADGAILLHNMRGLGIEPSTIRIIVISHAHGDHTGGLPSILQANKDAVLYVPASFRGTIPGRKVTTVTDPIKISDQIFSTGELKGIEQSLGLKTDKGINILVGCSHPGVNNIIDASSRFGKVHGIIGGFHGFRDFKKLKDLSLICPCHCTQYKSEIKHLFPEKCRGCGVGTTLEL